MTDNNESACLHNRRSDGKISGTVRDTWEFLAKRQAQRWSGNISIHPDGRNMKAQKKPERFEDGAMRRTDRTINVSS